MAVFYGLESLQNPLKAGITVHKTVDIWYTEVNRRKKQGSGIIQGGIALMKVKRKGMDSISPAIEERSRRTMEHALSVLRGSSVAPYINHVYLYGSCARKEQTYKSDVDLLVELADSMDIEKYRTDIMELRGNISPVTLELPAVDMQVVIGEHWKKDTDLFYKNIRRDGIEIWDKQDIPI